MNRLSVRDAQRACVEALLKLEPLFVEEMELMIIAAHPSGSEKSLVVGSVSIDRAIEVLAGLKDRPIEIASDVFGINQPAKGKP